MVANFFHFFYKVCCTKPVNFNHETKSFYMQRTDTSSFWSFGKEMNIGMVGVHESEFLLNSDSSNFDPLNTFHKTFNLFGNNKLIAVEKNVWEMQKG